MWCEEANTVSRAQALYLLVISLEDLPNQYQVAMVCRSADGLQMRQYGRAING